MKSPFAIFRKHQRVLTVILTGLAMFAFIIMDQLDPSSNTFPILMGALVLGGLFWLIGARSRKPVSYAAAGAILGAVLGFMLPNLQQTAGAVQTNVGDLSSQEIQDLVRKRQIANNFIRAAYDTGNPLPQLSGDENEFLLRIIQNQRQQELGSYLFGFVYPMDQIEEDVVVGYLLRHEARKLGVVISDQAVIDYIDQVSNEKLSSRSFTEITRNMGISATDLYDILRDELAAREAWRLTAPRTPLTPAEYWQNFRKLHVTSGVEVAAIPVDAFTGEISQPSERELRAFFEEHKNTFPGADGEPGFRQTRKVNVAYLEADYVTVEESLPEISDAEIQAFYEQNKDRYRLPDLPEPADETPTDDSASKDADNGQPILPELTPDAAVPATDVETDSSQEKPAAEPDPSTPNTQDSNPPETPEPPASDAEPKESDDGPESGGDAQTDEAQAQESFPRLPEEEVISGLTDEEQEAAETDSAKEPAADEGSTEPKDQPAEPAPTESQPTTNSEPDADSQPASDQPVETQPTQDQSPESQPADAKTPETSDESAAPQYRPLNDDLRSEIRDILLREKTQEAMRERIERAVERMYELGRRYNLPENHPERLTDEQIAEELKSYARQHGLRYAETGLLSADELQSSEEHAIGSATEPSDSPFERRSAMTVAGRLFGTNSDQLYSVDRAEDPLTNNQFAYWPIKYREEHVPSFDEPGIREQVLQAWKQVQARPKARDRAQELAKIVREAQAKPMSEVLGEHTVTGLEGGQLLTVRVTPEFSWYQLTSSSARGPNPFEPPQEPMVVMSNPPGIDNPGQELMRTIFEELNEGDVGVAPNRDRTVYYVVRVRSRNPSEQTGLEALRQQFLQEDPISTQQYRVLAEMEQQGIHSKWYEQLEEKYAIDWTGLQRERQRRNAGSTGL